MRQAYIVRDTIDNLILTNLLVELIKEQIKDVEVFSISYKKQKEYIRNISNVINLDPYTRNPHQQKIDISRVFLKDTQNKPVGYIQRENCLPLEQQILLIPSGEYILVDDDICSGGTISYVKKLINSIKPSIKIIDEISLLHEVIPEIKNGDTKLYDTIDTHDFIMSENNSGLLIKDGGTMKRYLYTNENVNLKTRAKIPNPHLFLEKFNIHTDSLYD